MERRRSSWGGHGQKPGTLAGLGAGGGQGRVGGTLETTDGFHYLGGGGGYGSAGEHSRIRIW